MATRWFSLLVIVALTACSSGNPLNGGTRKGCNITAVEGDSATMDFVLVTGNNVTMFFLTSQQDPDRHLFNCELLNQPDPLKTCNEQPTARSSKFSIQNIAPSKGLLLVQLGVKDIERSMEGDYSLNGFATVALPAVVCTLRVAEAPTTLRTVGLTTTSADIVPKPESNSQSTGTIVGVVIGLVVVALVAVLAVVILRKSSRDWLMSVLRRLPCCPRASKSSEDARQPEEVRDIGGDGTRQEEAQPFLQPGNKVNEVDGPPIELQDVPAKPPQGTEPLCEETNGHGPGLANANDGQKMDESLMAEAAGGNGSAAKLSENDPVQAEPPPRIGTVAGDRQAASTDRRFDWPVETLTREETQQKLLSPGQVDGAFLIRHTSQSNTLALAVRRQESRVSFHKINIIATGFEIDLSNETKRFQTLAELVKAVTTPKGLFDCKRFKDTQTPAKKR